VYEARRTMHKALVIFKERHLPPLQKKKTQNFFFL
jgi:hypothetical protein